MCDVATKRVLIYRCPCLSDGCKVTLLTWFDFMEENRCLPSLQETANLRGCRRSTIQAHLKEALDAKLLRKKNFGTVSVYTFEWGVFLKHLGLNEHNVSRKALIGTPSPKDTNVSEMAIRVTPKSDIKTSQALQTFFKAMYREKLGKEYATIKSDRNKCRNLILNYGASSAVDMVIFFLTHRGRLGLGETSIETLYKNRESIYEKTKNT